LKAAGRALLKRGILKPMYEPILGRSPTSALLKAVGSGLRLRATSQTTKGGIRMRSPINEKFETNLS
jgi:hypothetical protein